MLEDRKNNDPKIALILGSRTGALFRSESFAEEMAFYSTRAFGGMNERDRFSACYTLLQTAKKQMSSSDLELILRQQIRKVSFSIVDDYLADLVSQKVFKLVLSSNTDDLIYDAFAALGLKEKQDFVDFDLGRQSITDIVDEIISHEKVSACKVIKFYNDVDAFVHRLDKQQMQEEISQRAKRLLEGMWVEEVLVVGMDPIWDQLILSALPARIKTVWFVNEDEQAKDTFCAKYEGVEEFRFIIGGQGGYEKFLKALYWQISPGVPPRYHELTGQLQHQLKVIQQDLKSIKNGINSLNTEIRRILNPTITISYKAEEPNNYIVGEGE